jgi:N-acetylmuramoyl-L-alanine amidase
MGSKGQEGKVEIIDTDLVFTCTREDRDDFSFYDVEIPLRKLEKGIEHQLKLILQTTDGSVKDDEIEMLTNNTIIVKNIDEFPLIKTVKNNSRLTYTLAEIRLGGPMRAEYPPGIILQTSGKVGDNYRIKLSKVDDAYIDADYVEELPQGTLRPRFYISSLYCTPTDSGEVLRIPYYENVPYSIVPEPDQKRILINLYGVETSSTWLMHKSGRKIIDKVTWQQTTPETYQIIVNLNTTKIWGYDITQSGKSLIFRIKYPPEINSAAENPLKGLKIAIEAGHGGANVGAVGLSGILEKDINLDLSLKLGELCEKMGAEVLQVRDTDRPMYLSTKRDTSRYSGADIHISIHANASGSRGGYLGVSGTSHYYHNPFWAPLAEMIHNNVLEMDIDEFGLVGSFNYTVTRMTEMPAILVEQAFMSNAEDEEKLADENFRQEMAEKIYEGILEYINYMSSE